MQDFECFKAAALGGEGDGAVTGAGANGGGIGVEKKHKTVVQCCKLAGDNVIESGCGGGGSRGFEGGDDSVGVVFVHGTMIGYYSCFVNMGARENAY